MIEWKRIKLSEVCNLIAGYAFKSCDFGDYPKKVVKITNIEPPYVNMQALVGFNEKNYDIKKLEKYRVSSSDYILAMTGATIGKIGRIRLGNAYINQRVLKFCPKKIDNDFLFYILSMNDFSKYIINNIDSESAQANISASTIGKYTFSLPPLDVQKRIAGILGALDDRIDVLRRENVVLEQMAQAVFQSWFVDFDIVRAKAAGLPAADICKKYHITPDIYDLFPSAFSADNLPQGWTIGKIKNLCFDIQSGGTPQRNIKEYWCPPTIPWLSSGEVNFPIIIHTKEKISEEGLRNSSAKIWKKYTTVVAMYGATAGEATLLGIDVSANQACCALIPYKYTIYYVYLLAKANKNIYALAANGAAQQNLNKTKVSELEVIIPDAIILTCFQNLISSFFEKIIENSKQIRTLEQTRDALLPKLMNGEIEV